MGSAFGAGEGGEMLQRVLAQKRAEQFQMAQMQNMAAQRELQARGQDQQQQEFQTRRQDVINAAMAKQQAAQEAAATEKAQNTLRAGIQGSFNAGDGDPNGAKATRDALRVALTAGGADAKDIPQEPAASKAPKMYAVTVPGPNGKPVNKLVTQEQMQQGVEGYRAPQQPSQTHARFNIVQGADANGKPAMIRTNVDTGQIEVLPVPAGANFVKRDQPATEGQTNLAIYASRIGQAEPTLKQLEGSIAGMNPLSYEAQTKLDKPYLQSKEMQSYSQAARQFVNSVLRRESGAVISPSEFDSARKQYLPMPGDSQQALAQKAAARSDVITQFTRGAGPAGQHAPAAAPDAASKAAELLKKYGGG